jgi:phosphatidylinositol 4-kinase
VLAQQLIRTFKKIFDDVSLPLWLRPYEVSVTGGDSGLMEFVENTVSVDALKKEFPVNTSLAAIFDEVFADCITSAKMNFVESLAGYSIVCFLLQVKDRHNANLLLASDGHMIHIDFGFMLANAPGNLNFETSPFKLTQEYLDIMGGEDSELFESFQTLLIRGFLEVRKHSERLLLLVQLMGACGGALPCFSGNVEATVASMRERFYLNITDEACMEKIVELIDSSINNWRTNTYDSFQRLTNGIL